MTDIERFNLFWLCYAMTAAVKSKESYYYDARTKKFFVAKPSGLFNMIDLSMTTLETEALLKRMADIDTEASEIVELPRLNVQDKVAVQLLFLSKFSGVIHEEELRLAAEKQQDANAFVLDAVLNHEEVLALMAPY